MFEISLEGNPVEQPMTSNEEILELKTCHGSKNGMQLERLFTTKGVDPLSKEAGIEWEKRDASIKGMDGQIFFEQKDVLVPKTWSQSAHNIVVSKYFHGTLETEEREDSIAQLISRVSYTIADWGLEKGYFKSHNSYLTFKDELSHILINQHAAFNSPVWFNVGVEKHPQCSACFINSVDDEMSSILDLCKTEGMLFKYGSGAGSNLSKLRGSHEGLNGGGTASGPLSFMKGLDSFAGAIKSGGKTRRAAKMVILDVDHPDIEEFIDSKMLEEKKAWALIDAGYDGGFNVQGGAYDSVQFQNGNHSIRVSDEFMNSLKSGSQFHTIARRDGTPFEAKDPKEIWKKIADAAWVCGDPGIQFDTMINKWHTCKETARIEASNPCSEYMFLSDSACNLASINLMKYRLQDGQFDVDSFKHTVNVLTIAMEIIVESASYPTEKIAENSFAYRPLGLGYANLGALLMSNGLPYDSDEGRGFASGITALMGGEAYATSAELAKVKGAFSGYEKNKDSMLNVIEMHRNAAFDLDQGIMSDSANTIIDAARESWQNALNLGQKHGFRNAQATVLAPTGTIGFMMDCDTTGVEPDIALVKYKTLVGGGMMKLTNNTVPMALKQLRYTSDEIISILSYIDENDTIEGCIELKSEHIAIFDCAFKAQNGTRSINPMGHVKMMAAVQPFLSGAISKTVNMPETATSEEIANIYLESWKLGLKAVAIYRDGSKRTQPLNTGTNSQSEDSIEPHMIAKLAKDDSGEYNLDDLYKVVSGYKEKAKLTQKLGYVTRRRLPDERQAITHKFSLSGHEGYITVGLFDDGQPGELFCTMSKEGSTISGLMDVFATSVSLALQYGVPLSVLVNKFSHTRFEPSGFTGNPQIPMAKSVSDYIFRWLGLKFLTGDNRPFDPSAQNKVKAPLDVKTNEDKSFPKMKSWAATSSTKNIEAEQTFTVQSDAPPCLGCGSIMVRNGACYKCFNCGSTSGCS